MQPFDGRSSNGDHIEVEWHFDALDLRPVERWLRSHGSPTEAEAEPGSGAGGEALIVRALPVRQLVDRYADTEDWRLYRAGFTLRIRRHGRRAEATLKSLDRAEEGVRRRREITEPVASLDPDALRRSPGPVGERVQAIAGRRDLSVIFEIRTRRTVFAVERDGRMAGEIALDRTTIPLGQGEEPARLQRVEVEVAEGSPAELARFVSRFRDACGLQAASLSKFQAGLLASGREPPPPPNLGTVDVGSSSTVGQVAFGVLRGHFATFLATEAGTRLGEDPEALHDMRVAARRLRAGMALFEPVLPLRLRALREELGWVGSALGAVRDLDVQLEQLRMWIDEAPGEDRAGFEAVSAVMQTLRAEARAALLETLDSPRYEHLVSAMATQLRRGPLRTSALSRVPAVAAAPEMVRLRHRRVKKAGRRASRSGAPEDLHRLRIRCKRFRYALEFFDEVYEGKQRRLVKRLAAVQDVLGLLQDSVVAVQRLRHLALEAGESPEPAAVFVMGQLAERYAARSAQLRRRYPRTFAKVRGKPWRRFAREMSRRQPPPPAVRPAGPRAVPPGHSPGVEEAGAPTEPAPADRSSGPPSAGALAVRRS